MWVLACALLAALAVVVEGVRADDLVQLLAGTKQEYSYAYGSPVVLWYQVNDFNSRIDITIWSNIDQTITGEVFSDESMTDSSLFATLTLNSATTLDLPFDDPREDDDSLDIEPPQPIYIRLKGTQKNIKDDTIYVYVSDGVYIGDGGSSNTVLATNFYGNTRYYKFFVCDSDENVKINFELDVPEIQNEITIYAAKDVDVEDGKPNATECANSKACLLEVDTLPDATYSWDIEASNFDNPGWLIIAVTAPEKTDQNWLTLTIENMDYQSVYTTRTAEDKAAEANLCMYESCTSNFQYTADTTQSLAVSAWNNNRNYMLVIPPKVVGNTTKGIKTNNRFYSDNGFLYISAEEMQTYFPGTTTKDLYFSVNNNFNYITYPIPGQTLLSPIKFGICQGCDILYPHGSKYEFSPTAEQRSRGRFMIPFSYDLRSAPEYQNIKRHNADVNSPLRPSYAFVFRNYKSTSSDGVETQNPFAVTDNNAVINKCGWEFLLSTTYSERTTAIEEHHFDASASETTVASGGAGVEITVKSVSQRTDVDTSKDDNLKYFYREEMTIFGSMYPNLNYLSPGYCSSDVNYLYVGDIHEMNPYVLCGKNDPEDPECTIDPELKFTSEARSEGGYYPLHIKVTLKDTPLLADYADNFVISVTPTTNKSDAKILIVGSTSVYLPDPDYDNEIISHNGYYTNYPTVTLNGKDYKDKEAIYFTIDFQTKNTVIVTFSREERVEYIKQGILKTDIEFLDDEFFISTVFDATSNSFTDVFFAAMITNKDTDNAHHGAKFCMNSDPNTKPSEDCTGANKQIQIASNSTKSKDTLIRGLTSSMTTSASYIRVGEHPTTSLRNSDNAKISAMFGAYREFDGQYTADDDKVLRFDAYVTPLFIETKFNSTQDGVFRVYPTGVDDDESTSKITLQVCTKFPALYSTYTSDGCRNNTIYMTRKNPAIITVKKGDTFFNIVDSRTSTGSKTAVWGSIFGFNISGYSSITVDFAQSDYINETKNNNVDLTGQRYAYVFGETPKFNSTNGEQLAKEVQYIISVNGNRASGSIDASGSIYYSQSEIHPQLGGEGVRSLSWPGTHIITLENVLDSDRIYFGIRCTNCSDTAKTSITINGNLVYLTPYEVEPDPYLVSITPEAPKISYYDITSHAERPIPHNAISFYFYPYNINDGIQTTDDFFTNISTFKAMGGDEINEVNNKSTNLNTHNASGRGILPITMPTGSIVNDIDGNKHVYFSIWKDSSALGPNPTIGSAIFDVVASSFNLDPSSPFDDTIWHNDAGIFYQNTTLDYVPILMNYKPPQNITSAELKIEVCKYEPHPKFDHKICRSKYVHNPGPDDGISTCEPIGNLNEVTTVQLDLEPNYYTFYAIHSRADNMYTLSLSVNGSAGGIIVQDSKIGYTDFVASESVNLRIAPAFGNVANEPYAAIYVYAIEASQTTISYTAACAYQNYGKKLLALSSAQVEELYNESQKEEDEQLRGLLKLAVNLSALTPDVKYYLNIVAACGNFKTAYEAITVVPNESIGGLDVTPEPSLWWVWLIVALVILIIVVGVLVYFFIWKPRNEEKKQYQELNERDEAKVEAIAVEDENNEPLA